MRRLALVGGLVLAGGLVPALAAAASGPTVHTASAPALGVTIDPVLLVGGGMLPLEITLDTASSVSITLTRGALSTTTTENLGVGTSPVAIPLVGTGGAALPAGGYAVTVAATAGGTTTTSTFNITLGAARRTAQVTVGPLPGGRLGLAQTLTFTFSQPIAGDRAARPKISPAVSGHWSTTSPYTLQFIPSGFGFAPGATETITDRAALWAGTNSHVRTIKVRQVAPARAQQLLAQLGYLPLTFTPTTPVARTQSGQANAAALPPSGTFEWRYKNAPSALVSLWNRRRGVMVTGAIKAFESDHHLATDGALGPGAWRALELAAISGRVNRFGYSFVHVYRSLPQHLNVWHWDAHGRATVFRALVNTGIAGRPTNYGIFPIFLRQSVGSMSGTNPDGSHYNDGGIRWISYFSGGDALHQFYRPGYGYPQSLGCVEMTNASAHRVWQLTELGTLVDTLP